jgi:DNA-binding LytR/AlgR family response regulator
MAQTTAIIAEDEEQLRNYLLKKLMEVWPELHILGAAENGVEALELIQRLCPHVAFLDIRMPGLSGMEVAKNAIGFCRVVFITAYDQYAVEAFETEAVDYLLKPVTRERLEKTVLRLKEPLHESAPPPFESLAAIERMLAGIADKGQHTSLRWVKVQEGKRIQIISVDDICYFKASDKYTLVRTTGGESLIKRSIKDLSEQLDPDIFWQIHRGTLVNVRCISGVSRSVTGRGVIRLKDVPESLTVSRSCMHLFKQM